MSGAPVPFVGSGVRLPRDLPDVADLAVHRPPEGRPEEVRVGAATGRLEHAARVLLPALSRPESAAEQQRYPFTLPPPPAPPPRASDDLRAAVARLGRNDASELATLRTLDPALASRLEPLLAAERSLVRRLELLLALRDGVESIRRTVVAEPR